MDFDLGQPGPSNFPRLDNEFHDDADKLHSDLVGLSLDATAASAAAGGNAEEAEAGMWSLQLEDPRKKRKGGDGAGDGGGGGSGGDLWGEKRTVKQVQRRRGRGRIRGTTFSHPSPFLRDCVFYRE